VASKSLGDLAVDGLLQGLAAGAIMLAFLLGVGMLEGVAPTAVLARFGLPGSASAVTGLLGHLAVSAVLGLVWGVLYGSLLRRAPLPAWVLGAAYGLLLYVGATVFVVGATGLADFAPWQLLLAHGLYGLTLGLLSGRAEGT
jgi:zinc transporter ZupT